MPSSANSRAIAEKMKAEGNAAYQKQKWGAAAEVGTLTAPKGHIKHRHVSGKLDF